MPTDQPAEDRMFRMIVANMAEGVYLVRATDGVIVYANPKFEQMFGYGPGEIVGRHVSIVNALTDKKPEDTAQEIIQALKEYGEWSGDILNVKKNGAPFWCHATVSSFEHPEYGRVWLSIHQDISDRKRAEESLRLLMRVVKQAPVSIVITDYAGTIVYVNPAFERLTGYTAAEALGKNPRMLKSGTTPPEVYDRLRSALARGDIWQGEFCNRKKNGDLYRQSAVISPVSDSSGTITHYVAVQEDITEQRRNAEALQESENRYHSLFENMLDGFAYCKMLFENGKPRDFVYLEVNNAFERLTGLKNVVGKKVSEVIPEIHTSYPSLLETYGKVTMTGQPEKFELYFAPIGAWLSISVYSPAKEHFVAVFENITQKKQSDQEVRFHSSIIQNIPEAVCAIDRDGNIMTWNSGAEKMLGYAAADMIGKPLARIIPQEIVREELDHCLTLLNTVGHFSGYVSVRLARDGKRIPVELTGVAIGDENGAITGYASIFQDITLRNKAEEERLKAHMLESVGLLAGGVAHDFRNLLCAITGSIAFARMSSKPGDKVYTSLAEAEKACEMANTLTTRFITFATGGDPVMHVASMKELITGVVAQADPAITVELDLPEGLHPVAVDAVHMTQAVRNIVENAKEAMPQGGILAIRAENVAITETDRLPLRDGNYVAISFIDHGAGIPGEVIAKIFDPYYSTKNTYSQKGLGLGLAVSYSVVKRHHGLLSVDSVEGTGTTFRMYLPSAA